MSARDVIALRIARSIWGDDTLELDGIDTPTIAQSYEDADNTISALFAMPLASRHALAQALVPAMAVVPREATVTIMRAFYAAGPYPEKPFMVGWTAMLTAAEKENRT